MNSDCWSHTSNFLSLKDLITSRYLNKEICASSNHIFHKKKHKYLLKKTLEELIRKKALKDWVHRSPLLCCITGDMQLMTSRFGCANILWDPPLGWRTHRHRFSKNYLSIDSDEWGTGQYIDSNICGWNRSIWENRFRFMQHKDCIIASVNRARNRIYNRRKREIRRRYNFSLV